MREIQHSALVARPPGVVFALINDIDSYPRFLPWCTHARVLSRTSREIVATIGVQRGPLTGEFTTRNELEADRRILMHLVDGPFRQLEGEWLLTPIEAPERTSEPRPLRAGSSAPEADAGQNTPTRGCRVQLRMAFAFKNRLTAALFEQKFAETAASLLDAFVARARDEP